MGLRALMQETPLVTVMMAGVIVLVGTILIVRGGSEASVPQQMYFYDLDSGELFAAHRDLQPPIDGRNGEKRGVRAFVYSCGECADDNREITYLMTYSDDAQQAAARLNEGALSESDQNEILRLTMAVDNGRLVAAPPRDQGAPQWVPFNSDQGSAIARRSSQLCGDKTAKLCFPH